MKTAKCETRYKHVKAKIKGRIKGKTLAQVFAEEEAQSLAEDCAKRQASHCAERRLNALAEVDPELLKMDGYDTCIVGVVRRFGQENILCYDLEKVLNQLVQKGMTREEAEEWFEFNMIGSWVGPRTPCFLSKE